MSSKLHDLTPHEFEHVLPVVEAYLGQLKGRDAAQPGSRIVQRLKALGVKIDARRLRKMVHYLSINSLPNLVACANGYFLAQTDAEMFEYLSSLGERINAQQERWNAGMAYYSRVVSV